MSPEENRLLSTKQAALFLGVAPKTLRRWCNSRQITYYVTVGGHKRFSLKDLYNFINKSRIEEEP